MDKFKIDEIRRMIQEELLEVAGVDHKTIANVTNHASKLLQAVEAFEEHATDAMKNATISLLPELKKLLEAMVQTPGSYVSTPKPKRVIQLRQQKPQI